MRKPVYFCTSIVLRLYCGSMALIEMLLRSFNGTTWVMGMPQWSNCGLEHLRWHYGSFEHDQNFRHVTVKVCGFDSPLIVFHDVSKIIDGRSEESWISWRYHSVLCRISPVVASQVRCGRGICSLIIRNQNSLIYELCESSLVLLYAILCSPPER